MLLILLSMLVLLPLTAGAAGTAELEGHAQYITASRGESDVLQLAGNRHGWRGGYFGRHRHGGHHYRAPRHYGHGHHYYSNHGRHGYPRPYPRSYYRHFYRGYGYYNRHYYGVPGTYYGGTVCWYDHPVRICVTGSGYGSSDW